MTTELIVFPDVVSVVKSALDARLAELGVTGVPVVEKVPAEHPARFVRLVRTGGASVWPVVDRAMITVEAWATSDKAADALAQAVRAVIKAMRGTVVAGIPVYTVVEFSGPANVPDPVSRRPRFTWTVEIGLRGSAA